MKDKTTQFYHSQMKFKCVFFFFSVRIVDSRLDRLPAQRSQFDRFWHELRIQKVTRTRQQNRLDFTRSTGCCQRLLFTAREFDP
jgi:hypothetical protein